MLHGLILDQRVENLPTHIIPQKKNKRNLNLVNTDAISHFEGVIHFSFLGALNSEVWNRAH
jgi:tRNA(Leu) C34 or U34 (ribose-2'-O)-methylase TrmL